LKNLKKEKETLLQVTFGKYSIIKWPEGKHEILEQIKETIKKNEIKNEAFEKWVTSEGMFVEDLISGKMPLDEWVEACWEEFQYDKQNKGEH
jgi:hypothetical protein